MKIATAYYLFLFYAAASFKPVLPYFSDFLAHTFAHQYHVSNVHQQHGAAHVHQEVTEAASQTHDEQKAPATKFSEPVSAHIVSQQSDHFTLQSGSEQRFSALFLNISKPLLNVIVPPPKDRSLFV